MPAAAGGGGGGGNQQGRDHQRGQRQRVRHGCSAVKGSRGDPERRRQEGSVAVSGLGRYTTPPFPSVQLAARAMMQVVARGVAHLRVVSAGGCAGGRTGCRVLAGPVDILYAALLYVLKLCADLHLGGTPPVRRKSICASRSSWTRLVDRTPHTTL